MNEHAPRPTRRKRLAVAGAIGLVPVVLAAAAIATPGLNVISGAVQARGTIDESQIINSKSGVHLKTKGSTDIVTQKIVIGGGGHTGWHSHPGPVLVTIKAGALRVIYANDSSCEGTVYGVGDSFVDRGDATAHIARNDSLLDDVELWATYFVPGEPNAAFRLDEPAASSC